MNKSQEWYEWALERLKSDILIRLTVEGWPKDTVHAMIVAMCDVHDVPHLGIIEYSSYTKFVVPKFGHRRIPQPLTVVVWPVDGDRASLDARSFFRVHVEGRDPRWYDKDDALCCDGDHFRTSEVDQGYFSHRTLRATLYLSRLWGMVSQAAATTGSDVDRELLRFVEMKLDALLKSNTNRMINLIA